MFQVNFESCLRPSCYDSFNKCFCDCCHPTTQEVP